MYMQVKCRSAVVQRILLHEGELSRPILRAVGTILDRYGHCQRQCIAVRSADLTTRTT